MTRHDPAPTTPVVVMPAVTAAPAGARHLVPLVLGILGVGVAGLATVLVVAYLLLSVGPGVFVIGGLMALVPLAIVIAGAVWVDRWEPEPRLALAFAFLWGAGVSVLAALIVGAEVDALIGAAGGIDSGLAQLLGAVVQAPVVEEVGKGLALLLIFWVARRHFDGPVDGVVYAAWVAAGFAFTENILYFGGQILETGTALSGEVVLVFVVRGLMSPFAHVMFTACTGIAVGIAARRGDGPAVGALWWLLGLVPAILLHAVWNGALYIVPNFFASYFLLQFPLFIGILSLVVGLRRQEAQLTRTRLAEYAAAGWIHPAEVDALATATGRRQAMAWANGIGKGAVMRRYIRDATALAFARQRVIIGRDRIGAQADEAALLQRIEAARTALAAV